MHTARIGRISPPLVGGIVILLAGACLAWYLNSGDSTAAPGMTITVNGKQVDPREFKAGSFQTADGHKIELKGGLPLMSGMPHQEYFKLTDDAARRKFLDDFINQQEEARKKLGITTDPGGTPQFKMTAAPPTTQPGNDGQAQQMKVVVKAGGDAGDSIAPETRAQIAEFLKAVNDRRRERGLPPQQGVMMFKTAKQGS